MKKQQSRIWTKDFTMIVIANLFIFLAFQMSIPTLPLYVREIGASERFIGLVVGIFTFSALLVRPKAGQWIDSKGRAPVFLIGLIILTLSTYSLAVSFTILILLVVRVVQGVGWGLSNTASGTVASDLVPRDRRGEGLGYFGLSGNIALAIGPALGLFLVDYISFQWLFVICGILTMFALLLALTVKYPKLEVHSDDDEKYEVAPPRFDFVEKKALPASTLLLFITLAFGGIATFLPAFTFERGFESHYIQIYFVIYAFALLITRLFAGQLYDRKGLTIVFVPGAVSIIIAMILLAQLWNPAMLFTAAVLYGLGFGSIQPALQAWAVNSAPNNRRGMANATYFSAFDLGVGCGAILFGFVAEVFPYSMIYYLSAASVTVALILFIIMRSRNKQSA
ncbi:MFS transporter [Corticicoccus populi]|uniref:MFS transporter n=1 Tax=Corticicoccus populi TaxID=1812821 RepID=A0ABW5WU17_9STAP